MSRYHVNPATGNPGPCRATTRCPFGSLEEDHYPTEAEARSAYEASQGNSFAKHAERPAAATPTDSYLDGDSSREMWARGALVGMVDSPPHFSTPKPLGTAQGFMAGRLYDHSLGVWQHASFTPDGRLAFVDTNRSFSGRPELTIMRWEDDQQDWVRVPRSYGGDASDIAEALRQHGYRTTTTGMIGAADRRKYKKELQTSGKERPGKGTVETRTAGSPRPEKLAPLKQEQIQEVYLITSESKHGGERHFVKDFSALRTMVAATAHAEGSAGAQAVARARTAEELKQAVATHERDFPPAFSVQALAVEAASHEPLYTLNYEEDTAAAAFTFAELRETVADDLEGSNEQAAAKARSATTLEAISEALQASPFTLSVKPISFMDED